MSVSGAQAWGGRVAVAGDHRQAALLRLLDQRNLKGAGADAEQSGHEESWIGQGLSYAWSE